MQYNEIQTKEYVENKWKIPCQCMFCKRFFGSNGGTREKEHYAICESKTTPETLEYLEDCKH